MEDLNDKVANGGINAAGKLAATEWNQSATELQNVITAAGLALSAGTLTQALSAITKMASGGSQWCADSGSSSAYVLTPIYTVTNALYTGLTLTFRPANNNSGANPTVNYNGTVAITIKNESGGDIVAGDLNTARDAQIRYDGTYFRLLTNSTNLILNNLNKRAYIRGFLMTNGVDDPDDGLFVGTGETVDFTGVLNLNITAMEKVVDVLWSAGDGGGGKPAALTITNNTFYYVFLIGGTSASTDVGIDSSSIATNLLSTASTESGNTYNRYRHIGFIRTDGSTHITKFYMNRADYFHVMWETPFLEQHDNPSGTSRITLTTNAPPSTEGVFSISISWNPSSGSHDWFLDARPLAMTDVAASRTNHVVGVDGIEGRGGDTAIVNVPVDGNRQMAIRRNSDTTMTQLTHTISCRGYRFKRGAP